MKGFIKNRVFGGALLIMGTTVGVGMLGFPTVTSFGGLLPSIILFILVWLLMLASSFLFLDVNLSLKGEINMVTMAEKTLGNWGRVLSWMVYLLLLYALTAAYIAGSTRLFVEAIHWLTGFTLPGWIAPFSLPVLFGGFIYIGTHGVDLINRFLMFGLVVAYVFLIFFVPQEVEVKLFSHVDFPASLFALPVIITTFGYHVIIPSLTTYLDRKRASLKKAIILGSIISLGVYLLWQILMLGAVPISALATAYQEGQLSTVPLAKIVKNPLVTIAANLFAFFAMVTSFVGVTLSLADFITDGFKIKKTKVGRLIALLITFFPPLFFVFTYEKGFYKALEYAGAFVAILLIFMPGAMAWTLNKKFYKKPSGKFYLTMIMVAGIAIFVLDIMQEQGFLKGLIAPYLP